MSKSYDEEIRKWANQIQKYPFCRLWADGTRNRISNHRYAAKSYRSLVKETEICEKKQEKISRLTRDDITKPAKNRWMAAGTKEDFSKLDL